MTIRKSRAVSFLLFLLTTTVHFQQLFTTGMTTTGKAKNAMHWFRRGLRLHDNPALMATLEQAPNQLFPVFVLDGDSYQLLRCTPLRANFLIECLQDLDASLQKLGSRLYVLEGDPTTVLPNMWKEWDIGYLSWEGDESGEPYAVQRDETLLTKAQDANLHVLVENSETLYPLEEYVKKAGTNKGVPATMTGFQKVFGNMPPQHKVLPAPTKDDFPNLQDPAKQKYLPPKKPTDLPWPRTIPKSEVESLWGAKDCKKLTPLVHGGETLALKALKESLQDSNWVATFEKPKTSSTSIKPATTALSPYLSWGCLSPRQVWAGLDRAIEKTSSNVKPSKPPVSLHGQMLWRDFNNLMAHDANKATPGCWNKIEGNKYCRDIPWDDDPRLLEAWKTGHTGFPWIDACMRQLAQEGWIHHLGRHAVACFLTRGDLWQSWEEGAKHFEAQLLDADYALNGFNWMWLSCSGFFYQYFRCYSPIAFQKKNDPNGTYIRHFVPELKDLPAKYIYEPWEAPASVLEKAGVMLGKTYPRPVIDGDHKDVSKDNMSRMKAAYDSHKARAAASSSSKKQKR